MEDLNELRNQINDIDKQIIKLFEQRMDTSRKIGDYKKANNLPIYDEKREEEIILRNASMVKNQKYLNSYLKLLNVILTESKNNQK